MFTSRPNDGRQPRQGGTRGTAAQGLLRPIDKKHYKVRYVSCILSLTERVNLLKMLSDKRTTYRLDELDVGETVLPGDATETLTTGECGGVGGTTLESGDVGGDHTLDTAIENEGWWRVLEGRLRDCDVQKSCQHCGEESEEGVLPDKANTSDLGTSDGHVVLTITSQRAQLHEWRVVIQQQFEAITGY